MGIQLGYDSAFAESLTLSGGRRSRRPNKRYSDGADDSTAASEIVVNVETAAPVEEGKSDIEANAAYTNPNLEIESTKESIKIDAEVKNTEEEAEISESKMEVEEVEELNSSNTVQEQTFSSVETVEEVKEEEVEKSLESIGSEESLKLELVDTSEDTEIKVDTSKDIEMEIKSEGVIPAEETFAEVEHVSQPATSPESPLEKVKKETSSAKAKSSPQKGGANPKSKELASLMVEPNSVVNELPNGKVRELRKRKAANGLNSSASSCKGVEEEDFYGWAAPPPAPRTGWKLLELEEEEEGQLEEVGATFGFVKEDILLLVKDQDQGLTMEVVMSPPMVQDTKRVEKEGSTGSTKKVAFPESDQDERGSQSPSSFGSSKENVPEICNNTTPLQKGCPNISKRRRSNKNPVLKTNTVV